jgi:hypothetical protein
MPKSTIPPVLRAESLAQSIERARELYFDAQVAVHKAAARVAESRRLQSERQRWKPCDPVAPGPIPCWVCCAYCARVTTPDGQWGAIPVCLSANIHKSPAVRLSHGYCADCLARPSRHFPGT